ncbi:MAG: hypothetical protein ACRD19_14475 [Terriglobia bacterium]
MQPVPAGMNYLTSEQNATIPYAIYGGPSESLGSKADRARGVKYTMLTWSWINVRGGGVARALIRNGDKFYGCADVPSILLSSVADPQTKTATGWVEAIYGAIRTGNGGCLYGWTDYEHRHGDEPIMKHLTQLTTATPALYLTIEDRIGGQNEGTGAADAATVAVE